LERADSGSFSAKAPIFEPGAPEFKMNVVASSSSSPATPLDEATYQYMYNQLLFQYNTEVPFLRHQVMDLTGKLAELEKWKLHTSGLVRDLRDQHRAIRRKIGEDPSAPAVIERSAAEVTRSLADADEVLSKARVAPPAVPPPPPTKELMMTAVADSAPQDFDMETGLKVYKIKIGNSDAMRAEWRVNHFCTKLRSAMGRPVVSASFDMWDFTDIRLMITPEAPESSNGPRSRKEKEQFSKMVTEGPVIACLTLKVANSHKVLLKYVLRVGSKISAPFEFNFSNSAIDNRGPFRASEGSSVCNWLEEMKDSSITVGVDVLMPPGDDEVIPLELEEESPLTDPEPPPGLEVAAPRGMELTVAGGE